MSERVREDMFPHDYSCRKKRTYQFPKFDFPNSGRTVHKDEDYLRGFNMKSIGKYSGLELIIDFNESGLTVTYKTIEDFIKDIRYYGVYDPYDPLVTGIYIYDHDSDGWVCCDSDFFANIKNSKNCEYISGITTIHELCEFLTILDLCWWTRADS